MCPGQSLQLFVFTSNLPPSWPRVRLFTACSLFWSSGLCSCWLCLHSSALELRSQDVICFLRSLQERVSHDSQWLPPPVNGTLLLNAKVIILFHSQISLLNPNFTFHFTSLDKCTDVRCAVQNLLQQQFQSASLDTGCFFSRCSWPGIIVDSDQWVFQVYKGSKLNGGTSVVCT